MITHVKYVFTVTLKELFTYSILFIANVIPDLTIFSIIRVYILKAVIKVGTKTRIRKGIYLSRPWKLLIGKNCFLNRNINFDLNGKVELSNNVSVGYNTFFITTEHKEKNENPKPKFTTTSRPIMVKENAWIGANCTILPGTIIGENSIIAAGAVVKGNIPPNKVYGGVPAKEIRDTKGIWSKIL